MMTEKQNKLLGVCASLGLHGLAVAILFFSLSGNAMIPQDLGQLDFVWMSLATKDKTSLSDAQKIRRPETPPAATRLSEIREISAIKNVLPEPEANNPTSDRVTNDIKQVSSISVTAAYPLTGGHSPVSSALQQAKSSAAIPVFSRAYPLYRENPPPGYPEMARQQGYEGIVLVQAEVLADGRVGRTVISKSSGYAILDQTAVSAVKAWKFEPAKKSGVPYKTWAELPIKFVISDHHSQS